MRTLLLAGVAIASLGGSIVGVAHAADIYQPAPGYSVAPPAYELPPAPYYPPPPAYRPPPRYGYAPPPVYAPPPAVAYDDDDVEEVAPPRRFYRDAPVYAEQHRRLDCWWEWGHRRCAPRHGW